MGAVKPVALSGTEPSRSAMLAATLWMDALVELGEIGRAEELAEDPRINSNGECSNPELGSN